ncbi:MFS transporter [Tomitella cavernea]|uniref:MFS transporter n=1 Tax=Tomitella cavernea TaxID=1387982 RepID=A0ABP9CUZ9_9ACTN|nr:MFS transporter [Tomitella cavernea]
MTSLAARSDPPAGAPPAASTTPPRRRAGLALSGSALTILLMAASAPSPFYPRMQESFGLSPVGITLVFAVYAMALLATLLTVGSLSDHIGRRPVITTGFLVLAGGMVLLWTAQSSTGLFAGRAVQGLASGFLLSALSASISDFAPPVRPLRAALLNAAAPMVGLSLGALSAGVALAVSAHAEAIVFGALASAYCVVAATVWLVPETSARVAGWRRSLVPRMSVPHGVRRLFLISIPIIVAGWATGGLFFSLGPDIAAEQLGVHGPLAQSAVIAVLPVTGMLAVFAMHARPPRTAMVFAACTLGAGTLVSLIALQTGWLPLYVAAVAVTGTGFGTGFMGVIGSIAPVVPPHRRGALFAALYTTAYLSFGVPTVIAGALVSALSLSTATVIYGIIVIAAAATAGVSRAFVVRY